MSLKDLKENFTLIHEIWLLLKNYNFLKFYDPLFLTMFLNDCFKTMRIFAWFRYLQKLASFGAIHRFIFNFFANQNFSRHRKTELLRKWIALVLQVKFRFMGCLVKANALVLGNIALSLSSQLIVLVFTKQPSAERYLANIFSPVFLWTFRKF